MQHVIRTAILATVLSALAALAPALSPAIAMDNKVAKTGGPDLTKARALIKAESWKLAVSELKRLEGANKPDADIYNLLGFSLRKQGELDTSFDYYSKALKLDPNHRSAHEYLGELYIQKGDIAKAKEQAAILARLCPRGCEERADLDEALAAVK